MIDYFGGWQGIAFSTSNKPFFVHVGPSFHWLQYCLEDGPSLRCDEK